MWNWPHFFRLCIKNHNLCHQAEFWSVPMISPEYLSKNPLSPPFSGRTLQLTAHLRGIYSVFQKTPGREGCFVPMWDLPFHFSIWQRSRTVPYFSAKQPPLKTCSRARWYNLRRKASVATETPMPNFWLTNPASNKLKCICWSCWRRYKAMTPERLATKAG